MLRFQRIALLAGALTLTLGTVSAQKPAKPTAGKPAADALTEHFDRLLQAEFPAEDPGCAVMITRQGQQLYKKAHGKANLELEVALQPNMVFRIGSVTKQFTAAAILKLVEQGKLSLSDDLTKFLPDYPTHGKPITVEHLLTHTSGIRNYTAMPEWDAASQRTDHTVEEMITFFKDQPFDFEPGTRWNYSNSGYILLGYIIEKASGRTYANYLQETFFQPLGLAHTAYEDPAIIVPGRATGYTREGENGYRNAPYLSMTVPYAAGSIISTAEDLCNWTKALHAGRVIGKEMLKKMTTAYTLPDGSSTYYGYGFTVGNLFGSPTIEHNGGIHGFNSTLIYLPKEDVCVAALSNCLGRGPDLMAAKMALLAIGKTYEVPMIKFDAARLDDYTGVYENAGGELRYITTENGQLYSQRPTGQRFRIMPIGEDQFAFDKSLARARFERQGGRITTLYVSDRQRQDNRWTRTDKPLPTARKAIELRPEALEKFVGTYELAPGFAMTIIREGTALFAQATGQGRLQLYATTPTRFFPKEVPAEIEFTVAPDGTVPQLTLFQGGQEMVGKRK